MFIPLGGIFVFGGDGSRSGKMSAIVFNIFNLFMGGLALLFGFMYGLVFLQIFGFIIGGLGLFLIVINLIGLSSNPEHSQNQQS